MTLLIRILKQMRFTIRWRNTTFLIVFEVMMVAFLLHVVAFYYWERPAQEGLSVFDAVWVSFITMTTIGYGDISAATVPGRIATIVFSVITLGCFATVASELIAKLTEIHEKRLRGLRRLRLKNHILIVDWNKSLGKITTIVENLRQDPDTEDAPIVIVSEAFEMLPDTLTGRFPGIYFCHGSPTAQATYQQCHAAQARTAIVLASGPEPSADALTAAAVGVIEDINPEVETVAECVARDNERIFRRNGCDRVVFTGEIIPLIVAKTAIDRGVGPSVFESLDVRRGCTLYSEPDAQLGGYRFGDIAKCLVDMPERVILQGVMRGQDVLLAPDNDFMLEDEDGLILLGDRKYDWETLRQRILDGLKRTE